jgi:hypothetical protein
MNVKSGIHKSMESSSLPNRGTFPQPAGVKLAEDEVTGIHALSERHRQSQARSREENIIISAWQEK